VPVSVTSTNTNVGTITGSPAPIAVGTYYTQAISFVPATAGNHQLEPGTHPPATSHRQIKAVQLVTTVAATRDQHSGQWQQFHRGATIS